MKMEEEQLPPLTEADKKANARIIAKVAPILLCVAIAFMAVTGGLVLSGTVNLAGRTESLPTFSDRLEFTLKYQTLPALWLLLLIFNVIFQRAKTGAVNPLSGHDMYFKKQSNILQNSFEQFIISAFAQLILVSFINEQWTLRTIPWVNFLFFIGRVTFYAGYPTYRTFGILLGMVPSTGMLGVAVYKFFEHLFF